MKKGNKVLALFLAAVMLATSIAWDFSEVKAEETAETTSAITTTDDGVSIDFDNIDVAELDANGYVSTKFANGTPVKGEINQAVSKHWFSGDGEDTPYGDVEASTIKANNVGLKARDIESDGTRTFMYTPYTYEDFQVSAEIYYGAYAGIVFGEKNVYPIDDTTASSVAVFFNDGRIHIVGAIDNSTVKIMRGTSAAYNNGYSVNGRSTIFNNGAGDAISAASGTVRELNVKKTGNHLIVWLSGGSGVMTIKLADTYKTGWIGVQGRCYDGDGGGLKSLNIEKVHAVEHHELDNAVMSELDDMGYSVTTGSTLKKNSVGDVFFSGTTNGTVTTENEGIKPKVEDGNVKALNIPYVYENFRLEAEVYLGQLVGVAVGSAASYPSTTPKDSGLITAYFNNSWSTSVMFELPTPAAYSNLTRTGGLPGSATAKQFRPASGGVKLTPKNGDVYTIVLEVNNGVMKLWLKGYDGYGTATIASGYKTDKISLIARKPSAVGGFKSYTITNLDAGDYAEFDNVYLQNLTAAGYKASDCADSTLTDKGVSDVWFSGESYPAADTYVNKGLKPSDTDGSVDLLNLPNTYENFRLETEIYYGQVVGIIIGKKGVKPSVGTGSDNGAVSVYINGTFLAINGSIDASSVALEGGVQQSKNGDFFRQYTPTGNTATWGAARKIVIEKQGDILTISLGDTGFLWRGKVTSNYKAGNIALFARRYNTVTDNNGNPQAGGGLKSYTIEKLPSTANPETTVDVAGYTEFNFIDTTKLDAAGFKVSQYKTDGTEGVEGQSISDYMYAGKIGVASSGKVVTSSSNNGLKGKTVTADKKITILTAPYEYDNFRVSTEVYWGANTGIVIGEENVCPTEESNTSVRIYFNANQIQLMGAGFDYDTAKTTGGTNKWNPHNLDNYGLGIFAPASNFAAKKGAVYKLNVELIDGVFTIWVDGYGGVLTVKATDEFWNMENKKIALSSFGYDDDCGGLKSLMVEELSDVIIPYTAEEFATYRSADGHTAPTYKNYLFAGWYTEPTCSELENAVLSSATTVEEETVYAKFVVRDILTVKAQISEELLDNNLKNDGTGKIRFATTVDTLNYSQVGFRISYDKDGSGTPKEQVSANKTVYSTLNAIGDVTYQPTDFSKASAYFKACTVKNVGDSFYDLDFTVVPFWKTLDGTVVEGDSVVKTVNQGVNAEFLDGKTALFVGDSIQNGANKAVDSLADLYAWHERLPRYGMITEEVANQGWALTNKETSGRGQIVTQLDDAAKESYDFIILEGGVNDVRIDQDNPNITIDWGTINEDPNAIFSDDNIAGAMQDLIVKTQEKFPNATIVYIINHYFGATTTKMKNYVAMVKAACRVHDISYVDLSDTEAYPSLEPLTMQSAEYIPDNLHPNAAGYELSTPVIANHLRKLVTGELVDTVYVASTGTDAKGYGIAEAPYQTLNYALDKVADGGTVYVQDALVCANGENSKSYSLGGYGYAEGKNIESSSNIIDKVNHKQVTIAGANEQAKLNFPVADSGATYLLLNDSIILKDIQVEWPTRIFAEGNTFIVESSVKQVGSKEPMLMGGSNHHNLEKTDLRIYAGTYQKIIGGSVKNTIGETNVIVGGKVNENVDISDHTFGYVLYGGCYSEGGTTKVSGDTHVTVEEGAKIRYIYGGGAKTGTPVPTVDGETYVTVKGGNIMSVFGGGYKIPCGNTNVKILGGTIEQVFGGSESASASGNTNIELLGGEITRRVYGGCYNDFSTSTYKWVTTDCHVTGTTNVTIGPNAQITFTAEGSDRGVFAGSRYEEAYADEKATVIFVDGCRGNKENVLGRDSSDWKGTILGDPNKYDYLVDATAGGTVTSANGKLYVKPYANYTATVTGATADTTEGIYVLPNTDSIITVNFTN